MIDFINKQLLKYKTIGNMKETRPAIKYIKQHYNNFWENPKLSGCEIGINKGNNAHNILKTLNIKELILIEPKVLKVHKSLLNNPKVRMLYYTSDNCIDLIPDDSLDFIYIDGNHSYKQVKNDIINYLPKMKHNSIIAGHDFQIPDVSKAVTELIPRYYTNGWLTDWWTILKNGNIKHLKKK